MEVGSTISGFRGFLGQRTAAANVVGLSGGIGLLGPAIPGVGSYLQAPEGENWFTGLIRKVSQTVGLISMFCPALILPAAGLSLICAGMSFYSGNYMGGALELLGAIPIITAFRNLKFLQFKGMEKVALSEAQMSKFGVNSLKDAGALEKMAANTARAQTELKAAGEVVKKAGDKVEKAAEALSRNVDTLRKNEATRSLFQKNPVDLAKGGKTTTLVEQSRQINKTLKAGIEEAKGVQKLAQDAHKAAEEAVKNAGTAATEAQKTLLKDATKVLKDADKRVKELQSAQKSFHKSIKSWGHSRAELRYAELREDGFRRIVEDSTRIEKLARQHVKFGGSEGLERGILQEYNSKALQTITTNRSQQLEALVDRAYGPVAGAQMRSIIAGFRERGFKGAFEEFVRSTRSSLSNFWARTNPNAVPVPVAAPTTTVAAAPVRVTGGRGFGHQSPFARDPVRLSGPSQTGLHYRQVAGDLPPAFVPPLNSGLPTLADVARRQAAEAAARTPLSLAAA